MKQIVIISFWVMAQTMLFSQNGIENVNNALKTGNSKTLSEYFHNNVELTILKKQESYSKAQAEQIVDRFFKEHPPQKYKVNHNGVSGDGSKYVIGLLETANGNFTVYIYYKMVQGQELIQTLRFNTK